MLQLEDINLKQGDMVFFKSGTSMIITHSDVNKMHICGDCKLYIPETGKSTYRGFLCFLDF